MSMLHILNGGATETTLAQTTVPGSRFSFCDVLIEGPTPAINGSDWRRLRVQHLASAYGIEVDECELNFEQQEEVFTSFNRHDEVTLWFEADLFCQLNLLFVLDWFARRELGETRLSLICIGEFPGRPNFRGLGELNPDELASLFEKRNIVSQETLQLAAHAWEAYRSYNPQSLEQLLRAETSALPFLRKATELHLARFPSIRNGLNRVENVTLELIAAGAVQFGDLFPRFIEREPEYGFGDAQFWNSVQRLTQGPSPLLINAGAAQQIKTMPDVPGEESFAITEAGGALMKGTADQINLNGIDYWLGGVHLQTPANLWRWDEEKERLVKE
jgi:hypothetical protein